MREILSIAVAIMGSIGIAGAIIYALSNWLGKVWANRLLEHDKLVAAKEIEATSRKRDIYSKLAINMRVFLKSHDIQKSDRREAFLEAYDEAFLWASDDVVGEIGHFIDLLVKDKAEPDKVSMKDKQEAYAKCLLAMRKDVGYPKTHASFRIASF